MLLTACLHHQQVAQQEPQFLQLRQGWWGAGGTQSPQGTQSHKGPRATSIHVVHKHTCGAQAHMWCCLHPLQVREAAIGCSYQ